MIVQEAIQALSAGLFDDRLKQLYVDDTLLDYQRARYLAALKQYLKRYGNDEVWLFSAPGRSEIGGNHTDHQHGCVLAAAINLDAIAIVGKQDKTIDIVSDDMVLAPIAIQDLECKEGEAGTSESLVRGILAGLVERHYAIGGFKAYVTSDVLIGAGLSSSAAFEVLLGTIESHLYNQGIVSAVQIAQIGQFAENIYFGKPCGLMDQCASSVGSLVYIDFQDPQKPIVEKVAVDFEAFAHTLCIVDTKGSHENLTPDYAAVPEEMTAIAKALGHTCLREVDEATFWPAIPTLRKQCGDRAVLRALHFFNENRRVKHLVQALRQQDFTRFKEGIAASGKSSFEYLQNVYSSRFPNEQAVSLALALSEQILQGQGVSRVHGGGFAGTIQAFVPQEMVETYREKMEAVFGQGSCHCLKIRPEGGTLVCR